MFLEKFKAEIDQLWVHYRKVGLQLSHLDYPEDSVEVDLKEIQEFVEQTVLLLGQASNSISYCRRFYMLLALTNSPQQSKQILREDSELLQKNDKNLFGKKFRENHISKSKKQTLEMLSNTSRTKHKPFRHGGVSEGNNNKSFFSGKELRHRIQKNDMDTSKQLWIRIR